MCASKLGQMAPRHSGEKWKQRVISQSFHQRTSGLWRAPASVAELDPSAGCLQCWASHTNVAVASLQRDAASWVLKFEVCKVSWLLPEPGPSERPAVRRRSPSRPRRPPWKGNCLRAGEQRTVCCVLGLLGQLKLQTKELKPSEGHRLLHPGDNPALEKSQALAMVIKRWQL